MPSTTEAFTPAQVEQLLYEAGRTLMAMYVPGCWPSGYRSGMPDYLPDPEDMKYRETEYKIDPPMSAEVTAMDKRLAWVKLLPGRTEAQIRVRKIVLKRCLQHPDTERHVYSYRRLADEFDCSHTHIQKLWEAAINKIAARLNQPGLCAVAGGPVGPARRPVFRLVQRAIRERVLEAA